MNRIRVNALIRENRRITARELSGILNISEGSVKTIIKQHLQYSKVCTRWIPRVLTSNVAARTMDTIQKLKWNALPHRPYSPDLAPSDYRLFGPLKVHLGGKRFHSLQEVIQTVQPKDFFLSGIRKLPDRWCKCIAYQGYYVEK
jgi:hypothetical protein